MKHHKPSSTKNKIKKNKHMKGREREINTRDDDANLHFASVSLVA